MSSNINLIDSFQEFKEFKNIDRPTVISVLEEVFRSMIRKRFGTDENVDVIVNPDNGDLEIWRTRVVVEDEFSEDDDLEIELAEAVKHDADLEVGDDYIEQITLESFGRRAILAARQTLVSKILELEKDEVFKKYKDREGELVIGEVYQIWKKEILVLDDDGNELILPKTEQIPADYFKKGDSIRAVVHKVDMMNNNPKIIISRTAPAFLQRLFELEVPEIFDGLITIKKIVREPGERAKVAVESYDDRIDPVGACVGMKGSRIHGIVRELRNENIDVINFTTNHSLYITRALSPARISSIKIDEDNKTAAVYLKSDQVSLAIGRGGHNIKLAGKLTGYEIDVYRENDEFDEDVDIEEFSDEIEGWVIDELKRVGLDTAKSVLSLTEEELVRRTDLEEDTIQEIVRVLQSEFE
ncbi:transcription termination factor NusA [Sphingobacterium spiritivorum ATCC 33300]|uniref:Transcription termination/antitermination protein NusA n=3 Tax=Sphingobacterium spiritivorum TaxID=258 RepID=D7VQ57_SPHSI|nr:MULTISPECIES: transcription termination factor NusA [Sphingobacterium]EEI92885.1 transcription termination factor NusA [Sphingobacterium spiritivorum ATCC 33300]EFK55908.1 transcription termination factor NusA [Sphingobacterium spiritivorum ATCC 33861]QQS96334.1 transcription termination/antitermination protein NusA [Sphingobacterium spiritivorum]QQT25122.1 transcription termination/antitermination protein NusA [Sphingobacterium spiritivorum]QQT35955.1 transcription termination/antiterminat